MGSLTDYTSYADAMAHFSNDALWDLFDGSRDRLNIAHECIDRHASDPERIAVRIAHEDGRDESLTFDAIARWSARFAHFLRDGGIERGDRVAVMLEASLAFYAGIFGCLKGGAIAVPMFTLFGPEGARLRRLLERFREVARGQLRRRVLQVMLESLLVLTLYRIRKTRIYVNIGINELFHLMELMLKSMTYRKMYHLYH